MNISKMIAKSPNRHACVISAPQNAPGTGIGIMRQVDILLTSDLAGGTAPFTHGELKVVFHKWANSSQLPLLEGSVWVFIDWVVPQISGLEICRRLRCDPLTARAHITMILDGEGQVDHRRALAAGADDYIVGPVNRTALLDRIMSVKVADCKGTLLGILKLGDLTIDPATVRARWRGKPLPLMPNEFRLLRYLLEHPGHVFTRAQLIAALGKREPPVDERTVDVWIGRLRRALRSAGAGSALRTVRSLGYMFDLP